MKIPGYMPEDLNPCGIAIKPVPSDAFSRVAIAPKSLDKKNCCKNLFVLSISNTTNNRYNCSYETGFFSWRAVNGSKCSPFRVFSILVDTADSTSCLQNFINIASCSI